MLFPSLTILSLAGTLFAAFSGNPLATVLGVVASFGWALGGMLDNTISLLDNTPIIRDRNAQ